MSTQLTDLDGLMVSLGYSEIPATLYMRAQTKIDNVPADKSDGGRGEISDKELARLLHSQELGQFLDYAFNKHNNTYNIRVIQKAITIAWPPPGPGLPAVPLAVIGAVRVAFSSYEAECSGIDKKEASVIDALRAAKLVVARKQVREWLAALKESVAGRIQLYELLEIVPHCETRDVAAVDAESMATAAAKPKRDKDGLFILSTPEFLQSPDLKLLGKLDSAYDRATDEAQRKREQEEREKQAAIAAAQKADPNAIQDDAPTPLEEKLTRFGRLKEEIKDSTTKLAAATRGSTTVQPKVPAADKAPQASATVTGQQQQQPQATQHARKSSSVGQGTLSQSTAPKEGEVWDELSRKPQTKDVATTEEPFKAPTTWPEQK